MAGMEAIVRQPREPGSLDAIASPDRYGWRIRIAAVCIALTTFAFLQSPGRIIADSKTDLTADPYSFLARAMHLWNPSGNFGELQNQAYGYLWPMGPFFAAGHALGIPAWAVERLWWALLFCVAFTGMVALASRLRIGSPWSRIIAGIAFALSPRLLAEIGYVSIEAWPTALAPWVLVPLISLARGAPIRRAVALSAVAVACAGGVNATAVFAVVPLPLLWLATLAPARRRLQAIAAWAAAVLAATAWWLLPLTVLGRYSPPFLDYIETAEATTRFTDVVSNMRGTSYWVAYLGGAYGPALPAGWAISKDLVPVIASTLVAAVGLAGLARAGMPHRRFLVVGLLLGVALVGLGHVSDLDTAIAGPVRSFLDGVGAPLRNVHKFDVVLRIPLTLGLAHLLGLVFRLGGVVRNGRRPTRVSAAIAGGAILAAVAGVVTPASVAGLGNPGGYQAIPGYWRQAADYLNAHLGSDRVLVLPGARFANYTWGNTADEITQSLLTGEWAVRNAIPLAPPTTIRLLDSVESALSTGDGSTGLADVLARSSVRYVLLRSDLDYGRSDAVSPLVARQALDRSPGLHEIASFGPVSTGGREPNSFVDGGLDIPFHPLELYEVEQLVQPVVAYDARDVTTVVGGPESLLSLAAAGQLSAAPTVLAGDLAGQSVPGPVVLTDGMRRRDVGFGTMHDNASATLTADAPYDDVQPAHDYLPWWGAGALTTARYEGIDSITSSSSWSQARLASGSRPEYQPFAAVDGDPETSWRPAPGTPLDGQWIEIRLDRPQVVPSVRLVFDLSADSVPTTVTVSAGGESAGAQGLGSELDVALPGQQATRTVRVTIDSALGIGGRSGPFGLAEIEIPGLHAARTLVLPPAPAQSTGAAAVVLTAAPTVPACFFIDDQARCSQPTQRGSEDGAGIDRTANLPFSGTYEPQIWARPRPGAGLDAVLDREVARADFGGDAPSVTASSTYVADPAGRPGVVLDGNPGTAWQPQLGDSAPMLRMSWTRPQVITGLRFTIDAAVAASRLATVRVISDDGVRSGFLDADGKITFDPPLHTNDISIFVLDQPTARSYNPRTNAMEPVPVGIGEVSVLPATSNRTLDLDQVVDLGCGSGPTLSVNGTTIRSRILATRRDVLQLREVPARLCDSPLAGLQLRGGALRVIATASQVTEPARIALTPTGRPVAAAPASLTIVSWGSTERRLNVPADDADRIIAVRENTNPGWTATINGQTLAPVVVDGWQQGFMLPAGAAGEIVLRFGPAATYRYGLLAGAVLVLVVVLLAVLPSRRRGWHALPLVGRRSRSRGLPIAAGAAALISIGGAFGAALALVAIVGVFFRSIVPYRLNANGRRFSRQVQTWLPVVTFAAAGWLALGDDTHRSVGPQAACLVAIAALWLSTVLRPRAAVASGDIGNQRSLRDVVRRGRHHVDSRYDVTGLAEPSGDGSVREGNQLTPQDESVSQAP